MILTPIVSGIIKTAKKNAFESTGYGILESTKLYYSKKVGQLNSDLTFTCNNDTCTSDEEKLEFKGNINGSGTVLLFKDGNIALCLESSDYATIKNINDERLSTTENGSCEFDEETKEYSVNASVSAKLFEELQNQYTLLNTAYENLNSDYNNGKLMIANSLNNRGVEITENATFEEMAQSINDISDKDPYVRYNEETHYLQYYNVGTEKWVNIYYTLAWPVKTDYLVINGNNNNTGSYKPYSNSGIETFGLNGTYAQAQATGNTAHYSMTWYVDLTNITKITFTNAYGTGYINNSGVSQFIVSNTNAVGSAILSQYAPTSVQNITFDVSSITGYKYIGLYAHSWGGNSYGRFQNLYME